MEEPIGKLWYKAISMVLVLAIVVAIVPAQALATDDDGFGPEPEYDEEIIMDLSEDDGDVEVLEYPVASQAEENAYDDAETEITAEDLVGEDETLRSENSKHYKLQDGSSIAVEYETDSFLF